MKFISFSALAFSLWVMTTLTACGDEPSTPERPVDKNSPIPSDTGSRTVDGHLTGEIKVVQDRSKNEPKFVVQDGWKTESVSGNRKASFVLAKQGADTVDATLVVTYFGAQGAGDLAQNKARWSSQISAPEGASEPVPTEVVVAGRKLTLIEYTGRYSAEMPPGSGNRVTLDNAVLIAGIIEAPSGPHYLRFLGPEETIKHWRPTFQKFLESL